MVFNPNDYINFEQDRYDKYLQSLKFDTSFIEKTVTKSINNLVNEDCKSFVIYGEPQSGKTSMMVALTAKLLDEGYRFIIVLVQDNLTLEQQNLRRFEESEINPSPKSFYDILQPEVNIKEGEFIVFCKKNSSNLLKLLKRTDNIPNKVIIDDEADYASPNSKINRADKDGIKERTRINERIYKLLGKTGVFIGVTATPARLDLNNTFTNEHHMWTYFEPHTNYKGQDFFFPLKPKENPPKYNLHFLKEESSNEGGELRNAIYRFLVNASFVNLYINEPHSGNLKNYIMLIHTSVKMSDHKEDRKVAEILFSDLKNKKSQKFFKHLKKIHEIAYKKTRDDKRAKEITKFIAKNGDRNLIGVLNSDKDNKTVIDITKFSEKPSTLFTISIGGNVISRGVTFDNLLGMYFTRGVKTLMQQDTYIQRARMFGNRGEDIQHFELTIPEQLYQQWWTCFFLHRLSYQSAMAGQHPVWLEGAGTRAVAPSSVDRAHVRVDKGTMSFEKVKYNKILDEILNTSARINDKRRHQDLLYKISECMPDDFVPKHVLDFIETESQNEDFAVAIHNTVNIEKYADAEYDTIYRARSFFGANDYSTYPLARHHFKILKNQKGYCRMIYNFRHGKVSFLKNKRINDLREII